MRPESPPRELLVVMLSAIGDAVHVLPVVTALRRAWPDTRISWVIQPVPAQLVRGHPAVDELILFNRRRGLSGLKSFEEIRSLLAGRRFDLVLDLQVYFKAGVITSMANAARKLGFDRSRARDLNWLFTTEKIEPHPVQHVQDQYFEFLDHLDVNPEPVEWKLELTPAEIAERDRFYGVLERPAVAVVLGTSKPAKNWAPEGYARVLDALHVDHGLTPVLVGGPSELEREMAARTLALARAPAVDALGPGLRRLLYLLDGARLVISPDTGPLHMARAIEKPVVGLYGHTNPKRYGPYRKYEDLIVDGYARSPGEDYPPSMEYRDGMKRITPEAVMEKVALALERYPNQ